MAANTNVLKNRSNKKFKFRDKLKIIIESEAFAEMAFAAVCGVLILTGWIFSKLGISAASNTSFILAYIIGGYFKAKEGIIETIQNKSLNVEILMILAAIGSAIIGYWEEGAILIFIFAVSGALESYTLSKSQKELTALMNLQPEEAWLIKNGNEIRVPVKQLCIGDMILVKPGEQIPSDGVIVKGRSSVNEAAITGEALPVDKFLNDEVFAGTVNGSGSLTIEITKPNSETLFQKIITLVENAQNDKSPSQQFLDRFETIYVYIILVAVSIMMFLPQFLLGWTWNESFYRAMVLLVVASPCAVVASITPATLAAISNGARNGILFKGGVHLETLGNLKAIAFDKTGTLTKGTPEVTNSILKSEYKGQENEILQAVASIENHSNHPLAQAIVKFVTDEKNLELVEPDFVEDVSGWGIKGKVNGATWKIGKKGYMSSADNSLNVDQLALGGNTAVYIQKNEKVVGAIALRDTVRSESKTAIAELQRLGIQPVMITGDNESTAKVIASELGIQNYVAECLPDQKVNALNKIKNQYGTVAMVGDGINDAPALAAANVGIAMGEGTDVALETADVVLMKNELGKISKAVQTAKKMNLIIKQNLIFSIAVILVLVTSNFFQAVDLPLGVIGHEGSTILVILNGLRLLKG